MRRKKNPTELPTVEWTFNKLKYWSGKRIAEIDPTFLAELPKKSLSDKGFLGKFLERMLNIPNSNGHLDLQGGELKCCVCKIDGEPRQTVAITQIGSWLDQILKNSDFSQSHLFSKIRKLIYAPICGVGDRSTWYFFPPVLVDLDDPKYSTIRTLLEEDYKDIAQILNNDIKTFGKIGTSNGVFIQLRTKDTKSSKTKAYHPIFSQMYNLQVSEKNYAFYFRKPFLEKILRFSGVYPNASNVDGPQQVIKDLKKSA
ncbi:DNA mismatch repair protein MutH [bacterium]|nr:DNA mismatch repair protein MutH [bacterium]